VGAAPLRGRFCVAGKPLPPDRGVKPFRLFQKKKYGRLNRILIDGDSSKESE
jgi:hypothetical protein